MVLPWMLYDTVIRNPLISLCYRFFLKWYIYVYSELFKFTHTKNEPIILKFCFNFKTHGTKLFFSAGMKTSDTTHCDTHLLFNYYLSVTWSCAPYQLLVPTNLHQVHFHHPTLFISCLFCYILFDFSMQI